MEPEITSILMRYFRHCTGTDTRDQFVNGIWLTPLHKDSLEMMLQDLMEWHETEINALEEAME